jgi:hypothetical protein
MDALAGTVVNHLISTCQNFWREHRSGWKIPMEWKGICRRVQMNGINRQLPNTLTMIASLLILLSLCIHTTASQRKLATKYDLSKPTSAEQFFANSNINVEYADNELVWTAETPLAVGCGVSVLVADAFGEIDLQL